LARLPHKADRGTEQFHQAGKAGCFALRGYCVHNARKNTLPWHKLVEKMQASRYNLEK